MRPPKRTASSQKKKTTVKQKSLTEQLRFHLKDLHPDLKNWFSKDFIVENFSNHPIRQLIAVGVALDTMKQLENQMVMRNYSGFLK